MTRILTTHVGSLPRSQIVADLLFAREKGLPVDLKAYGKVMDEATSVILKKQKDVGIDIPSDGETSKISYATYIKDRLTGFDGDSPRNAPQDLKDFPASSRSWPRPEARRSTGGRNASGRSR